MLPPHVEKSLQEHTGDVLEGQGLLEDSYRAIDEILAEYPEAVARFVAMFEDEADRERRGRLALIVIEHQAHPGVIRFLREERGWGDEDFWGTAGELVGLPKKIWDKLAGVLK